MDKGTYKWGGKDSLSSLQKEFLLTLSSNLNLDEKQTFELVDLFFARNPHIYANLVKQETSIDMYSKSLSTTGQPASQDMRVLKLQEYTNELKNALISLTKPITDLYYEERLGILKASAILGMAATIPEHPLQECAMDCINNMIKTKNYENGLWDIYFDYKSRVVQGQKLSLEEKEQYFQQLINEEFCILQIFFVLYYQIKSMDPNIYLKMLTFFIDTQFQGGVSSYYRNSSEPHIASYAKEINILVREIIDLAVLLAIEGLKCNPLKKAGSLLYL